MARGDVSRGRRHERGIVQALLIGYGGFLVGTILVPISPTLGGIIFWAGVFLIFWAGWSSSTKKSPAGPAAAPSAPRSRPADR